jgi:hypothetical protein
LLGKKMEDARIPFEEALKSFRKFAASEGRPTNFWWITQDRVRVFGRRVWLFRPEQQADDRCAERFYESVRMGYSSIKILGIDVLEDHYVTCVEEMPSPPHHPRQLYMSLHEQPRFSVRRLSSRLFWFLLCMLPSFSRRDNLIRESIALSRTIKEA